MSLPFTSSPLEHSRAPLAMATCRACASRSRVSWDSACVSADDVCVCLSAWSNNLESSDVSVARESIWRSDRRPKSPFSFSMFGKSMKTWTWKETNDPSENRFVIFLVNVGRVFLKHFPTYKKNNKIKITHLKNTEVECREKRPHIRLAFSGAVGQSQLFVSSVSQRRFDAPANQTTQWCDIK